MRPSVEVRAATVDEAVTLALSQIGLDRSAVLIEVLSEGKRGLFGAARKAHVRVSAADPEQGTTRTQIAPAGDETVRGSAEGDPPGETTETAMVENEAPAADEGVEAPEVEDGADEASVEAAQADGDADEAAAESRSRDEAAGEPSVEDIDEEADLAADFVEGLLDLLDLPGDIEIEVQESQATVTIQDVGSGLLIGRRGATLDALQELVRCAVQRQTERRSHVRVDVEDYRARHIEKLRMKCRDAIAQVRETGESVRLEPMDAYERKLMHDLVAKTRGVTSESEGNEPRRRVVIHPES